jgi:hypothetical protein
MTNLERMLKLVDEVFDVKNDPGQLDVDQDVIDHLIQLHPSTVSEYDDGNGPVAWILLIPTSLELMNKFISKEISENELYELTPLNGKYEAIYLCSGVVLEEYRRKGIAKRLTLSAIENIKKDHPVKALFAWSFTKEGDLASEKIAALTSLTLYKRI